MSRARQQPMASASVCGSFRRSGSLQALDAAQAKSRGALVDAHQAAPHQRLQRGRRQIFAAQFGQRQLAAAGRQLGQNCLLLLSQRGQPRLGNQHREALRAPRIALHRGGLARDPFFAHQCRRAAAAKLRSQCAAWTPSPARPRPGAPERDARAGAIPPFHGCFWLRRFDLVGWTLSV